MSLKKDCLPERIQRYFVWSNGFKNLNEIYCTSNVVMDICAELDNIPTALFLTRNLCLNDRIDLYDFLRENCTSEAIINIFSRIIDPGFTTYIYMRLRNGSRVSSTDYNVVCNIISECVRQDSKQRIMFEGCIKDKKYRLYMSYDDDGIVKKIHAERQK